MCLVSVVCCFKQKTAYEMRISDWISDVCSSDLAVPVMSAADLMAAQRLVRRVPVGESVVEMILALVRAGRPESSDLEEVRRHVAWGPGPRASQALLLASRARAVLDGRYSPSVHAVLALAHPEIGRASCRERV